MRPFALVDWNVVTPGPKGLPGSMDRQDKQKVTEAVNMRLLEKDQCDFMRMKTLKHGGVDPTLHHCVAERKL